MHETCTFSSQIGLTLPRRLLRVIRFYEATIVRYVSKASPTISRFMATVVAAAAAVAEQIDNRATTHRCRKLQTSRVFEHTLYGNNRPDDVTAIHSTRDWNVTGFRVRARRVDESLSRCFHSSRITLHSPLVYTGPCLPFPDNQLFDKQYPVARSSIVSLMRFVADEKTRGSLAEKRERDVITRN